jgi:O-antigen/teichoic acid export membrane protein
MIGPIALGTIRTTFVLGLRLLVQAATLLVVARALGPQHFGAFSGAAALALLLGTLSTFGTHLVLMREVSCQASRRESVLSYAVPTTLMFGAVLLLIFLLVSLALLHTKGVSFSVLLAIGIAEIWLQPLFTLPAAEQLALGRTACSQLLATLPLTLRLIVALVVMLTGPDDPLAVYGYGYLFASLSGLVIASALMPAPWPVLQTWRLPSRTELCTAWGYAVLNITAAGPSELDKTLATKVLPLELAGIYAAAARVIGATTLPIIALMLSSLPRLFREGQERSERTLKLLRWIFVAAFVYSLTLSAFLWLVAPVFLWLFGTEFSGVEHLIYWLIPAVPGMALRLAAGSVLMALGKPWMRVGFEVIGLFVLTFSAFILVMQLGVSGMALALACSEWAMAIVGWALVITRSYGASTRQELAQ